MAFLFGLGLTITITGYAIGVALVGQVAGLDKATQMMWILAGSAAYLFGLSEVGLLKISIPSYHGPYPRFLQQRNEYLKSFFFGLFLGNAGVGCPNPAFYVLLGYISIVGSLSKAFILGFVHGLGRAIPLFLLASLALLGINASGFVSKYRQRVVRLMGWMLIIISAFIFINGLPGGHEWYEHTAVHSRWNKTLNKIGIVSEKEMKDHADIEGFSLENQAGYILLLMILFPIGYGFLKGRKKSKEEIVMDPVCKMKKPRSKFKFSYQYQGKKYYFCSKICLDMFKAQPRGYLG